MGQHIARTKMADALIAAVHQSIEAGHNPGRIGAKVLTAEAQGSAFYRTRERKGFRAVREHKQSARQAGQGGIDA